MDGLSVGLDAPRQPHRVAPEVVDELAPPDQAADHRAGVDADLGAEVGLPLGVESPDDANRLARELDHARGVVGPLEREARRREVRGADGPHLLDAVLLGGLVERADDVAQQAHRAVLAELARQRVEADQIDVRDGHVGERLRCFGRAAPDLGGGRCRQQALQQPLVLLHLAVEILAAVAKVPDHLVEGLAQLAVLVVGRDIDLHVQRPLC